MDTGHFLSLDMKNTLIIHIYIYICICISFPSKYEIHCNEFVVIFYFDFEKKNHTNKQINGKITSKSPKSNQKFAYS